MTKPPHWTDMLVRLGACREGLNWARTQQDYQTAWKVCEDAAWMLWLAGELSGPPKSDRRKALVLAACDCAETALPYAGAVRGVCEEAIETARRWARGEAAIEDVQASAASAANASAYAAAYAYNASAANASAYASPTAAAAYAASAAAYNASAAASSASSAYAHARSRALAAMANIVRRHYPEAPSMGDSE